MIQTIIFLSIVCITFMVLFIVTYVKYRKLESDYYMTIVETMKEMMNLIQDVYKPRKK